MDDISYPFEEFRQHCRAQEHFLAYETVTRRGEEVELPVLEDDDREGRFMQSILKANDYFEQCYGEVRERTFKRSRFILIMEFISANLDAFDRGRLAIKGAKESAVSEALLRAVHERFAVSDLGSLGHGPSVESVIQRAEHIAAELESDEKKG